MQKEVVSREEVIELAKKMAPEKLARWYELGLFIESRAAAALDNAQLMAEIAAGKPRVMRTGQNLKAAWQ